MTIILVDKADSNRDLQLANRTWDCVVTNLGRENVFSPKKILLLGIGTVGKLDDADAQIMADVLKNNLIPKVGDCKYLFLDGNVGDINENAIGYSLDTPYHLVSNIPKDLLLKLYEFVSASKGFVVH